MGTRLGNIKESALACKMKPDPIADEKFGHASDDKHKVDHENECISKSTARTPGCYICIICARTQISPHITTEYIEFTKVRYPCCSFAYVQNKTCKQNNTSGHMTLAYFLSLPKSKCGALQIPGKSEGRAYFKLFLHDK